MTPIPCPTGGCANSLKCLSHDQCVSWQEGPGLLFSPWFYLGAASSAGVWTLVFLWITA